MNQSRCFKRRKSTLGRRRRVQEEAVGRTDVTTSSQVGLRRGVTRLLSQTDASTKPSPNKNADSHKEAKRKLLLNKSILSSVDTVQLVQPKTTLASGTGSSSKFNYRPIKLSTSVPKTTLASGTASSSKFNYMPIKVSTSLPKTTLASGTASSSKFNYRPIKLSTSVRKRVLPRSCSNSSTWSSFNSTLDITGVKKMSPGSRHTSSVSVFGEYSPPRSTYERGARPPRSPFAEMFKLEPPKSPGPSKYDEIIKRELANLKPPVDPDDLISIKNISLEEKTTPFKFPETVVASTAMKSEVSLGAHFLRERKGNLFPVFQDEPVTSVSVEKERLEKANKIAFNTEEILTSKKSNSITSTIPSVIETEKTNEDLTDSTASFLLAEESMLLEECKLAVVTSANEYKLMTDENQEMLTEGNVSDSDEELEAVLQRIDQIVEDMASLKKTVEALRSKRSQNKNKENIPKLG